jgi:hypothetical protein
MLEEKPKMYINSFDINAHHANSSDPLLHDVVVNGNLNMLNKFLALTPNLNALNNAGRTALFVIPKTNLERVHSEMVKLLVKAGAVIDVRDENGRTAQEYWNMCPMFNMKGEPITTIDLTKIDTTPAGDMAPQAGPISIIVEDLLSELTTVSVQK